MYALKFNREREWQDAVSYAKSEGRQEGEAIGEKRGEKRGKEQYQKNTIQNLLRTTDFNDSQIAMLAGARESLVRQMRHEITAMINPEPGTGAGASLRK